MDSIIKSISNNEVIRKEFKVRFEQLLEKSKEFDIPQSNYLFVKEDLVNDELFNKELDIETNKKEILDYDYFFHKPTDYRDRNAKQKKSDYDSSMGINGGLINYFDVKLDHKDYDDERCNYPFYEPNQTALRLFENCIKLITDFGITINNIKVDMNQFI